MPRSASSQSRTGSPPATLSSSRRTSEISSVRISASNHAAVRICEAEIDHGIEAATPTASQSATRASRVRSKPANVAVASAMPLAQPQRHILAAAFLFSVAAGGQQSEQVDAPEAARILDQDQARQQRLRGVAQKRRQH